MDRLSTTPAANQGSKYNEEQQVHNNTKHVLTQQATVLAWLQQAPLNTLQARQELYIMSIASCIFELKKRGHNIVTNKVLAGSKKIAQYVLLSGDNHE
jgi:hypothetical protein